MGSAWPWVGLTFCLLCMFLVASFYYKPGDFFSSKPWDRFTYGGVNKTILTPPVKKEPISKEKSKADLTWKKKTGDSIIPRDKINYQSDPNDRVKQETNHKPKRPWIVLVIDDLGYNLPQARALFSLKMPLTVSILPHHPFSRVIAQEAKQYSYEVILHLPMEPRQYAQGYLEKGTLLTRMNEEEILNILDSDLLDIPWAVGVNNHMGSLMLEDERSMRIILEELKRRSLYFLDSRTTSHSVGYDLAQELDLPSAYRDVFLDNRKDLKYIAGQIDILIKKALKKGGAIGIGHLHPDMIQALSKAKERFEEKGINLLTLSEVVK